MGKIGQYSSSSSYGVVRCSANVACPPVGESHHFEIGATEGMILFFDLPPSENLFLFSNIGSMLGLELCFGLCPPPGTFTRFTQIIQTTNAYDLSCKPY